MEQTQDAYHISVSDDVVTLAKKETAKVNFDDGIMLVLEGRLKPRHVQFYCKTNSSGDAEACDFRLAKKIPTEKIPWLELSQAKEDLQVEESAQG